MQSTLKIELAQRSEAGVKPENQDTVGARIPEGSALSTKGISLAIADGVSSSTSARHASQTAISGFLTDYYATPDTWRTQQSATTVIQSLNRYLWGQSQNSVLQEGCLTTFSALILKGDNFFTFHVGDSRIYRFRNNHLEHLTRDHSQRIDSNTQYLTRALGADPALEIDLYKEEIKAGDLFLLTTDGIHDTLSDKKLVNLIKQFEHLEELVENIVNTASIEGSKDNISVQVCRIAQVGKPSQSDAVTVLSQLPFPPPLNVGQTIDGLRVEKVLHESERSQVYLVKNKEGHVQVMKTPSVNYEDDPAYIERFVMENWIGARIINAHVVRVIEPVKARSFLYYLTEYIAGQTLTQTIRERAPLAIPDATELIEQIIKGVRAFHRKDTLHQDIKPDNIMIGKRGPVIIDFGSCWVAGMEEAGAPFERDKILGTLDYSAPEYRCGSSVNERADQFSIAIIMYELITGKHPFGENYRNALNLKAFQRLKYIPASKYNPLVPIWLDRALEKAVSIHPNSRYTSFSEFLNDLKRPNPNWISMREQPFLERNPIRFWQTTAAIGWLTAIGLLFYLLPK